MRNAGKKNYSQNLQNNGIYIKKDSNLTKNQKEKLRQYFTNIILPTFKTHKQDIAHVFIENLHINLLVVTKNKLGQEINYIVDVPTEQFGRLIEIPTDESNSQNREENVPTELFFLEELVVSNLDLLYPNEEVIAAFPFRLTRNGEIDIVMDESSDFLLSVKKSVQNRKEGFASRLEFDERMPEPLRELLSNLAGLPSYLLYDFAVSTWACRPLATTQNRQTRIKRQRIQSLFPAFTNT